MKSLIGFLLLTTVPLFGQTPDAQKAVASSSTAPAASSSQDAYRSLFYSGLNKQQAAKLAETKGDLDAAAALRDEAADDYRRALEIKSSSTATNFNLALIEIDRGRTESAVALLKRGLEMSYRAGSTDADKANVSRFAEKLGDLETDPAKALQDYDLAFGSGKPSSSLGPKITKTLLAMARANPEKQRDVVEYGWKLFAAGDVDDALDVALTVIGSDDPFNKSDATEALTLATAALGRKNYDGVGFAGSEAFRRFSAMRSLPAVLAPRIRSLFALYHGDLKFANALSVWRDAPDPQRPYGRPTAMQAIQQLAHGIGYAAERDKKTDDAERFYRLAIDADPQNPDPAALRDLATLYYARNRLAEIEQLLARFETSLYSAKSTAYERVDWENVAEYHRTLATLYSRLHRDADAKVQFERQFDAVKRENEQRKAANRSDLLTIDSSTRLQYADSLSALNDRQHANSERLAAAEVCARSGKISCVRDAVAHVDRAELQSGADVAAFQRYLDSSVVFAGSPNVPLSTELKSQLALFATDSDPTVRKKAEETLRANGITALAVENGHGTFRQGGDVVNFVLPANVPVQK
jgi:tetratricopeptide (TPR) repeat protein